MALAAAGELLLTLDGQIAGSDCRGMRNLGAAKMQHIQINSFFRQNSSRFCIMKNSTLEKIVSLKIIYKNRISFLCSKLLPILKFFRLFKYNNLLIKSIVAEKMLLC